MFRFVASGLLVPLTLWADPVLRNVIGYFHGSGHLVLPIVFAVLAFFSLLELVTGHTYQEIAGNWDALESRHRVTVTVFVLAGAVVGLYAAIFIGASLMSH